MLNDRMERTARILDDRLGRTTRNARMLIEEGAAMLRRDDSPPQFSIARALAALVDNPHLGSHSTKVSREANDSRRIAERMGRPPAPGTLFVPVSQRDATVAGSAGYLVGTENAPGDAFVSALRANSVATALGVRQLPIEGGDAAVPKVTGDITTYWLTDEGTSVTEGNLTFGQVAGAPRTVGAYFEISDRLLKQVTPAGEAFIMSEAGKAVAAAVDAALINGSGASGQPTGILGTSGIGSASGATLSWDKITTTVKDVENANALVSDASGAWAIAPDAAKIARTRDVGTDTGRFILANGQIDGRRAIVSKSVPNGTALFGDWSNVLLVTWGALELGIMRADAGAALFRAGIVGVRCLWSVDVMVLQPESFSKLTSIS